MGGVGIWQIVIVAVVIVLLFGRGKISDLMGDVAKGIKSFKSGMAEDEVADADTQNNKRVIDHEPGEAVASESDKASTDAKVS
ncbi:MAG: twin-arginine translocase TatA/TatE family subunit [Rhizobiales bacterium]|nr:twin-arginine translocase TatA/TatE family subunit [Hyphomicrobiales bacterium]